MAVFLQNNCTYPDCRRTFSNLSDLIYHVEEDHIDFSPGLIEEKERQKVQCVPLSYVLKYSQLYPRKSTDYKELSKKAIIPAKIEEYVFPEHDTVLIESEISDDSFNDEFSNEYINFSRKSSFDGHVSKEEFGSRIKKFVCPVPGCDKRYKNINGIKYHTKNSHEIKRSPINPKKMHKCHCGKSYKTIQGLKAHSITHREINVNVHKMNVVPPSQLSSSQKVTHSTYPYLHQADLLHHNFISKSETVDEDTLPYPYLKQETKINDTVECDQSNCNSHLGFFTPPYPYGNSVSNEGFSDNYILEEAISQNYQFSLAYRKY
ncbi:juxtaposed with another zinc finger protein 1 [Holotrichia oblita]|uniref:Juxtaposed with another zinc finger protein 1 n=2 Tax=Holotrichia oblita TaxID=644536 RepID=A0ACB9TFD7_HOLOL|nr:juxtaposed with another zinc finger protein 1 [Holotrichia oblita]KAI4465514.1 juxtaposed with another zinc finger protein 1 [Holotrichia oblita]